MNRFVISAITISLLIFMSVCYYISTSSLASKIAKAHQNNKAIPLVSETYSNLSETKAYEIQKAYVEICLNTELISGYKAGITTKTGQTILDLSEAVSGVLFVSGNTKRTEPIILSDTRNLMIETEIGYTISKSITTVLKDTIELMHYIDSVMPVIELPDFDFQNIKELRGVDLIAANVAAGKYIVGTKLPIESVNLNKVKVSLLRNERQINTGMASDAQGNQKDAALWLINSIIDHGHQIEKGQIIITGVLGKMLPAEKGNYAANYYNLGLVEFEIK